MRLVRLIEEKYLSTETEYRPVDLGRKIQYMALDIIGQIAFGETLGFLDNDADQYEYIAQVEASLPVMQMIAMRPWVIGLLQSPLLRRLVMPSAKDPVGLGRMIGYGHPTYFFWKTLKTLHRLTQPGSPRTSSPSASALTRS